MCRASKLPGLLVLAQSCTLDSTLCHFAFVLPMQPYKYEMVSGLGVLQVIIIFVKQHPQLSLSEEVRMKRELVLHSCVAIASTMTMVLLLGQVDADLKALRF